jgi:hypothetical protein
MKRIYPAIVMAALTLGIAATASAQMGMDLFKKPAIAKYVNPVVGKGAEYQSTRTDSKDEAFRTMEMGVTAKDTVNGKSAFWMQIVMTDKKGESMVAKALVTRDDFEFSKMIFQLPGKPAMEMPFNPANAHGQKMQDTMNNWHSVGTETITVPAGTFACEHWKNDKDGSDLWASDKVTPFGMVKQVGKNDTMVLTKILTDVPDKITGPVSKFDPQQMMQQMQQQRQQKP